jgi:hypothetical protein
MTVTRLKRKNRRNKTRAKDRTATLSQLRKVVYIKSPYKGVSGEVIEEENA